jgi:ketosteroid isomerase-like protein
MSEEENKALARRTWEIVNQRNADLIEEFYSPDLVWHEPDQDIRGYEQAKQFVSSFFNPLHHARHPPRRDGRLWPSH